MNLPLAVCFVNICISEECDIFVLLRSDLPSSGHNVYSNIWKRGDKLEKTCSFKGEILVGYTNKHQCS